MRQRGAVRVPRARRPPETSALGAPQVPDGWTRRTLNDMLDKHTGGLLAAGPGGRRRNGRGRAADSDEEDDFLRALGDVDWT